MRSPPSARLHGYGLARLRCLRGIDTLSALGLCAETGEWERFDHLLVRLAQPWPAGDAQ